MASKGQKFKRYNLEFKLKVLKEYREGSTEGYLSQKYNVPIGTISTWEQIAKRDGTLGVAKKGRPKDMKNKDYKERYEILKKFQDFLVKQEQKKK
jgi:transposase